MRIALGVAGVAALSVITAGLVRLPATEPISAAGMDASSEVVVAQPEVRVEKRIRYVQLKRGETAPPGARVIDGAAPTPRVVVTRVAAAPTTRRVVVRTRQSGRP